MQGPYLVTLEDDSQHGWAKFLASVFIQVLDPDMGKETRSYFLSTAPLFLPLALALSLSLFSLHHMWTSTDKTRLVEYIAAPHNDRTNDQSKGT